MSYEKRQLEGFQVRGSDVPWLDPTQIVIVGMDEPQTDDNWFAFCPRLDSDLDADFIADIRSNGVRQPVQVYKDGDRAVLLAGRRRVRAARIIWEEQYAAKVPLAERIKVRVIVNKGTPEDLFRVNVSENAVREQLTPIQQAQLMRQHQKYGADNAATAKAFGCGVLKVRKTLSLLDLTPEAVEALETGEVATHVAHEVAKLPRAEQKATVEKITKAGKTKGKKAVEAVKAVAKGKTAESAGGGFRTATEVKSLLGGLEGAEHDAKVSLIDVTRSILEWMLGDDEALEGFPTLNKISISTYRKSIKDVVAKKAAAKEK